MGRADRLALLGLCVIWALACVVMGPVGEFPLNDDWSYALAARSLSEDGKLVLSDFTSMPLITQLLWGYPFLLAGGGFSFTALRVSTLVLAGIGILAGYGCARVLRASPCHAAVVALALMSNGVFVALSATYMSDVPFLALLLLAFFCLFRGLETARPGWVVGACGLALLATLLRQLGLAFFIGLIPVIWLRFGRNRRAFVLSVAPLLAGIAALAGYQVLLRSLGPLPVLYTTKSQDLRAMLSDLLALHFGALRVPLANLLQSIAYLGAWLAPVLLVLGRWQRRQVWMLVAAGAFGLGLAAWFGPWLPSKLRGNIWVDWGLGARTLPGGPVAPELVWSAVSALGLVGILALVLLVPWRRVVLGLPEGLRAGDPTSLVACFLVVANVVYWLPLACQYGPFFDRYLLLPFASGLLLLSRLALSTQQLTRAALVSALVLVGSVGFTHDYLAWNRVRWQLTEEVKARGGPGVRIAGGYEYDKMLLEEQRRRGERADPDPEPPDYRIELGGVVAGPEGVDRRNGVYSRKAETWMPWSSVSVRAVPLAPSGALQR